LTRETRENRGKGKYNKQRTSQTSVDIHIC
jgi:hypothetical protein